MDFKGNMHSVIGKTITLQPGFIYFFRRKLFNFAAAVTRMWGKHPLLYDGY